MKNLYFTLLALLFSFASYAIAPITGNTIICPNDTTTLNDATAGGSWSSNNVAVAAVGVLNGLVTAGPAGGTAVITYGTSSGSATITITVNPAPDTFILTAGSYCAGSTGTLVSLDWSVPGVDYQLYNGSTAAGAPVVGTGSAINFGTFTATGAYVVKAINMTTGCFSTMSGGAWVSVNPSPSFITGNYTVCQGMQTQLSESATGGVWSSSNTYIGTVDPTGKAGSNSPVGSTFIVSYSFPTGCSASTNITVNATVTPISGPTTVCAGSITTFSDGAAGGMWTCSNTALATINATGQLQADPAGSVPGNVQLVYTSGGSSCFATYIVAISTSPMAITGVDTICDGAYTTFSSLPSGGTWTSLNTGVAAINSTGTVTASTFGIVPIVYTLSSGCETTKTLVVSPNPPSIISSAPSLCANDSLLLSDATPGGVWSTSPLSLATVDPVTGTIFASALTGTVSVSYTSLGGCANIRTLAIDTMSAISATAAAASCGGLYTLATNSIVYSYSWSPATGLSAPNAYTTTADPAVATIYTITATKGGCVRTATVSISSNRISGHITYTGTATDTFRVWLIQYDPTDSFITSTDSTITCMDGGVPYYHFDNPPAGSYMVKAKLLGTTPGTSGYIPTYSLSSVNWNSAATATHTNAADSMHINMIYGTVPAGSGFISGNVYSGAGRNTNGEVPVANMLVYLEDATTHVLTYTYTNTSGVYTFSNLGYDSYIIYPEAYSYYTTPSSVIILNAATPSSGGVNFKQHTQYGTITPFNTTGIKPLGNTTGITLFPNPTNGNTVVQWAGQVIEKATFTVSDMLGREVYTSAINISAANGQSSVDLTGLRDGIYLISIKSGNIHYSNKLMIQR